MPHDRCPSPRLSVVPARRPAARDRRGNAASRSRGRRRRPARGHRAVQRVVGDAGMTATRAVFLFDMIQPFALATQRVAGFALGLSTCLFCWGVFDGKVLPRWLATGGLAAGAVAMALALVFREDTKADQAAFVLPVLWQVVTAAVMLRPRGLRG